MVGPPLVEGSLAPREVDVDARTTPSGVTARSEGVENRVVADKLLKEAKGAGHKVAAVRTNGSVAARPRAVSAQHRPSRVSERWLEK